MVRWPLDWQQFSVSDTWSVAGRALPFLVIVLALPFFLKPLNAQTVTQPNTGPPSSRGGVPGSGQALQLYKSCVLQSSMGACSALIERSKAPGFTNTYSVAAAHYKRGSIMARRDRLQAALSDYKAAASLFPFPQLDLEIARIEKTLRADAKPAKAVTKTKTARPPSPKRIANTTTQAAPTTSTTNRVPKLASQGRRPTVPAQRAATQPVRPKKPKQLAKTSTRKARSRPAPSRPAPSPALVSKSKVAITAIASSAEPWETITERVIHRYRARASRQAPRPVSRIFTELRGTCEPAAGSECTSAADEWLIADADFASALQHETDLGRDKPVSVSPYANLTTGSLPSFKAMSGLRPAPLEDVGPKPNPLGDAIAKPTTETTVVPQPAKFKMIARPALAMRKPIEQQWKGPSLLQFIGLLLICSLTAAWFWLRRQRAGYPEMSVGRAKDLFADDTTSSNPPPLPDMFATGSRNVFADIMQAKFYTPPPIPEVQSFEHSEPTETATYHEARDCPIDDPIIEPSVDRAEPIASLDVDHSIAPIVTGNSQDASVDEAPKTSETSADTETSVDTATSAKELENAQLEGSILIVASDDSRRQRLLRATLKAAASSGVSSLRPMIALDSTGALEELLSGDKRYQGDIAIVDWHKPEFAGSLNPFSVMGLNEEPLAREQALNKAFEIQCHISEGVLGAELVAQSRSQLRHLFRLMSVVPGADFARLRELLLKRDVSRYESDIKFLNSKSSQAFFAHEFKGRGFEKVANSLVSKLDDFLADDVLAPAILEPTDRKAKRGQANSSSPIVVVPIPGDKLTSSARSVMHRACLIRVMQHWPICKSPSDVPNNTTLVIDSLSHFELPDLLGFNQILREFMQSGRRIIACVSDPEDLPAGDCELVARHCSSKIIDGSISSQVQSLSNKLGLGNALLEEASLDESEDHALLLRSAEDREEAAIVTYE